MTPRTREILEYLDLQRDVLRAAFAAVPPSLRDRMPSPGCWSTAGVIEHLAIVEFFVANRVAARIALARAEGIGPEEETGPVLPDLNIDHFLNRATRVAAPQPVRPTGLTAELAWESLEQAGVVVRKLLTDNEDLALGTVLMTHPGFGEKSLHYYFAFVGAHEARHAAQIAEIGESLSTG